MKKLYFLALIMIHTGLSYADFNPGNFQIRLVAPGGEPGKLRVQMRAIQSGVVPMAGQFCNDLSFVLWWDNVAHPGIVDLDCDQATSIGGQLNEASDPAPGPSSGTGPANGKTLAISLVSFFQFPTSWVLNQWVNLCTVTICNANNCAPPGSPPGITAADFLIQGFTGTLPNITTNDDYTPANGPLPLNLISFKASKSGTTDAYLTWTTANEENTSHFVVQRSFDKTNWTNVGSVGAAGYSIDIRNYELYDLGVNSTLQNRVQVYYRLQMFDLDGKNAYSPIQSLTFYNSALATHNQFQVYPNPASDGVHVEWSADNEDLPTSLEFYDIAGKLVYTQDVPEETFEDYVDFRNANMQTGLYMLRIMNGTEAIEHKQIVIGQNR